MQVTFFKRLRPRVVFLELNRSHPNRYHEDAVWECFSHFTNQRTLIGGVLARLLEKYPAYFEVKLVAAPAIQKKDENP